MTDLASLAAAQAFVQDGTAESTAWVQACLDTASQAVIDFLGADPSSQARTETLSGLDGDFLYPRASGKAAPITAVQRLTIKPALNAPGLNRWCSGVGAPPVVDVDPTYLAFDAGCIYLMNGRQFPRATNNLTLSFTSGYATLPAPIIQAVLYVTKGFLITALGKQMNAADDSYPCVMAQSLHAGGSGAIPPAAQTLLTPYKVRIFSS